MGDTLKKIKEFLFQNKKRKIITICSLVLAIVILLSAILIPAISNMNKSFKSEEEMREYFLGTWQIDGRYYFVSNDGVATTAFRYEFNNYFVEMIKSAKDVEVIKNLTLESCEDSIISEFKFKEVDYYPTAANGHVVFNGLHIKIYIKMNNRIVALKDGEEVSITKISDDISLIYDDVIDIFNDAKNNLSISDFIPSFSELKEIIKTDSKTSRLVNTNWQMSAYNDNEKAIVFYLGNCTTTSQSSRAELRATDGGINLFTSDLSVSFDDLLTIVDLYLQDVPTYPGESVHDEIKEEMLNGEVYGSWIYSEFNLYGIDFTTYYYSKINGYQIIVEPKEISLS